MRRSNRARLGLCLPVLALLGLAGCAYQERGDGGYSGRGVYAYPPGGYYGGPYADPYGGYRRGWWGRDRDDRRRYNDDRRRYSGDDWKDRRYRRLEDNGRPGDAERFNDRLCRNGIPGDAPAGC